MVNCVACRRGHPTDLCRGGVDLGTRGGLLVARIEGASAAEAAKLRNKTSDRNSNWPNGVCRRIVDFDP